tara:strand:+ start:1024 stop:1257 length:234 start_codon:yes stop_codon:yes gene_type:complete
MSGRLYHEGFIQDRQGNTRQDYDDADKNCPKGYIVVWNSWEKGFKYRKLDKDGYVMNYCPENYRPGENYSIDFCKID